MLAEPTLATHHLGLARRSRYTVTNTQWLSGGSGMRTPTLVLCAALVAAGVPIALRAQQADTTAPLAARSIGFYAKGCLAGGTALPIDGPAWQAMRLSRNRNWGHPELVKLVEKLAVDAKAGDSW